MYHLIFILLLLEKKTMEINSDTPAADLEQMNSSLLSDGGEPQKAYKYHYFTLPSMRYSTLFKILLLGDVLLTLILWLTGKYSEVIL